jgi:hypothetical protein
VLDRAGKKVMRAREGAVGFSHRSCTPVGCIRMVKAPFYQRVRPGYESALEAQHSVQRPLADVSIRVLLRFVNNRPTCLISEIWGHAQINKNRRNITIFLSIVMKLKHQTFLVFRLFLRKCGDVLLEPSNFL